MTVLCKETTARNLDLQFVKTITVQDFDYGGVLGVHLGVEYFVMGIVIYGFNQCLYYLIETGNGPDLYPCLLFDVIDNRIPSNWYVRLYGDLTEDAIYSVFGYYELCSSYNYMWGLLDGERSAVSIFELRQREYKEELSMKAALNLDREK